MFEGTIPALGVQCCRGPESLREPWQSHHRKASLSSSQSPPRCLLVGLWGWVTVPQFAPGLHDVTSHLHIIRKQKPHKHTVVFCRLWFWWLWFSWLWLFCECGCLVTATVGVVDFEVVAFGVALTSLNVAIIVFGPFIPQGSINKGLSDDVLLRPWFRKRTSPMITSVAVVCCAHDSLWLLLLWLWRWLCSEFGSGFCGSG